MSYEKFYPGGWQSGESGGTPITPEALNHVENGIKQAYSDFAPSGYGYGGTLPSIVTESDSDGTVWEGLANAFLAKMGGNTVKQALIEDYPVLDGTMRFGSVFKHNDNNAVVYAQGYDSRMYRRIKSSGKWLPWESINPNMEPGVEYCTTERHDGSVVFAKRVAYSLGDINADSAVVDIAIPHEISNFVYLVRYHCTKTPYVLPYLKDNGGFTAIAGVDASNITLRVYKANWAATTWYIDLYYVKS